MFREATILVVKGSEQADHIARMLSDDFQVVGPEEPEDALTQANDSAEVVVCEVGSSQATGLELLRTLKDRQPQTKFVAIADGGDVNSAVEAMKSGAADCLVKPIDREALRSTIARVVNGDQSPPQQGWQQPSTHIEIPPGTSLEDLERAAVEQALAQHQGNRTHAAKTLGISVRTLQRKLKAWGIPMSSQNSGAGNRRNNGGFLLPAHHNAPAASSISAHAH